MINDVPSSRVLLSQAKSRDLIACAYREGLVELEQSDYVRTLYEERSISKRDLDDLLTQITSHDQVLLHPEEWPFKGSLTERAQFRFLNCPDLPKRDAEDSFTPEVFPSVEFLIELSGIEMSSAELAQTLSELSTAQQELQSISGMDDPFSARISSILADALGNSTDLATKSALENYDRVREPVDALFRTVGQFSEIIRLSSYFESSYFSDETEAFGRLASSRNDILFDPTTAHCVQAQDPARELFHTICCEIGAMPIRNSIAETTALGETPECRALRSFVRMLLLRLQTGEISDTEEILKEVRSATESLSKVERWSSVSDIATITGVPVSVVGFFANPVFGLAGLTLSVVGTYAIVDRHLKKSKHRWAMLGRRLKM